MANTPMHRTDHLKHPALRPLWNSLQQDWLLQLSALIALILAGVALALTGFSVVSPLFYGGLSLMLIGCFLLVRKYRSPSGLELLNQLLYEQPDDIVWVYTLVNQHRPFGIHFFQQGVIYFKLINKDEITAHIAPSRLALTTRILARALPHTVFGYSSARAAAYQRSPQSLAP